MVRKGLLLCRCWPANTGNNCLFYFTAIATDSGTEVRLSVTHWFDFVLINEF